MFTFAISIFANLEPANSLTKNMQNKPFENNHLYSKFINIDIYVWDRICF